MARPSTRFGLSPLPLAAVAALAWLGTTSTAQAAPRRGDGIHQGPYIYGSPGPLAIPVDTDDFPDLNVTWQWNFGAGYLFNPTRAFMISVGGSIEHTIYNFEADDIGGIQFRFMPEVRIGGGTRRVWGYGLLGVGPGFSYVNWDAGPFDDRDDADGLIALQFGGGVQGAVWRSLFLGGELDIDFVFIFDGESDGDSSMIILGPKFLIGWYF